MLVTVSVTQEDIDTARMEDRLPWTCWCPTARAIKRATGRVVWVEGDYVLIGKQDTPEPDSTLVWWSESPLKWRPKRALPQEASDFIYDFDTDEPVQPFSFMLDVSE